MSNSFRYSAQVQLHFAAAHVLPDYPGPCGRLHGHNWNVQVIVSTNTLNEFSMVMDFADIKKSLRQVIEPLDHHFLNEVPPFDKLLPTSENVAAFLAEKLTPLINDGRVFLTRISLWENERNAVHFHVPIAN